MKARHVFAGLVALAPLAVAACISDADKGPHSGECPTTENFPMVSQVFERRCGTLDCHGQPGRSFRVYGRTGLRLVNPDDTSGDDVSGGLVPTTEAELDQNYHSACGLEPEKMAAVVAGKADVDTLTLVRKPRLVEAHKGGRVTPVGSPGDTCITSWIEGDVDVDACAAELQKP